MKFALARFFRSVNANLIYIRCFPVFQLFKVMRWVSVQVYKRWKISDREVVIRNFDRDIEMNLDPRFSMGAILFWTGFHEVKELLFLHSFLKRSHVVLDVGANQGEFSLFTAKRVSAGGVYAFEPLPNMFQRLSTNIKVNGYQHVKALELAIGKTDGRLTIVDPSTDNEGVASAYWNGQTGRRFDVNMRSLDSCWLEFQWPRVDLIKLDIEGGEWFALQGARQILETFRPTVLIEFNARSYAAASYTTADVDHFLLDLGYQRYAISKTGKLIVAKTIPDFDNLVYQPK